LTTREAENGEHEEMRFLDVKSTENDENNPVDGLCIFLALRKIFLLRMV
jgi:hypothetical protein